MTSLSHPHCPTTGPDACAASTYFGNVSMPSTDQAGKAKPWTDLSVGDMGMAWTRSGNVSKDREFLDTSPEHVHGVDMFPVKLYMNLAASAKLEEAIKANRGLSFGG